MTLLQWTSRLRSHSSHHCHHQHQHQPQHHHHHHRRLYLGQLFLLLMTGFTVLTTPINASSSSSSSTSLHKRQYDANTLHLLHRDYLYEESGIMKESEGEEDAVPVPVSAVSSRGGGGGGGGGGGAGRGRGLEVLKRETAGVNMLKSSKDALIVTKKSYLKKDWCKTEPLIQRIKEPGCVTRTIVNRFCYGQCNSFYIPKDSTKMGAEDNAFKSCSFCKPKRFRWITITLNCPNLTPPFRRKRIQRVKKCKCISEILQS